MPKPADNLRAMLELLFRRHIYLTVGLLTLSLAYALVEAGLVGAVYPLTLSALSRVPQFDEGSLGQAAWKAIQSLPLVTSTNAGLLLFAVVSAASYMLTYAKDVLRHYVSLVVRRDCQLEIFAKWLSADYATFVEQKQGEVVFKVCSAPGSIGAVFILVPELVAQGIKIVAIVAVLCVLSVKVTCMLAILAASHYGFNRWVVWRHSYSVGEAEVRCFERLHVLVNESLNGIRELEVYGVKEWWKEQYNRVTDQFARVSRNAIIVRAFPGHAFMISIVLSATAAVLWFKSAGSSNSLAILPLVATYLFAAYRLIPVLADGGQMIGQIHGSLPSLELVSRELAAAPHALKDGTLPVNSSVQSVEFDRVSICHRGGRAAVAAVSLEIPKGITAIVGRSGSGKSTLLNLMVRLLDPTDGRVILRDLAGHRDLREVVLATWKKKVGFVGQDPMLVFGTIADNIAFSREVSKEEIVQAAARAHLSEFIRSLPNGYDTLVGEKGLQLSGGQRQRIAIARALVGDPEVLIFDEATSALDYETEAEIQRTISDLSDNRNVVIVAHRLSAVRFAQTIFVLDGGRLVESGGHQELLARNGCYSQLFQEQEPERWVRA